MIGLSLKEQLEHPWGAPFVLAVQPGGEARPRSPQFQALASLEEVKGNVVLRLSRQGLEHPTTEPELARLRAEFLKANLGDGPELAAWIAGAGKEPLKVGDRRLELVADKDALCYILGKGRAKFWPFA